MRILSLFTTICLRAVMCDWNNLVMARGESILKGMGELFRDTDSSLYTYKSNSSAVRISNIVEQKFGDMFISHWSNCSRLTPMLFDSDWIVFSTLCNNNYLAIFKYSLSSFSIETWEDTQMNSSPGIDCQGLYFSSNAANGYIITTCKSSTSLYLYVYNNDLKKLQAVEKPLSQIGNSILYQPEPVGFQVENGGFVIMIYDKQRMINVSDPEDRIGFAFFTIYANVISFDSYMTLDSSYVIVHDVKYYLSEPETPFFTLTFQTGLNVRIAYFTVSQTSPQNHWKLGDIILFKNIEERGLNVESRCFVERREGKLLYHEINWKSKKLSMCSIDMYEIKVDTCIESRYSVLSANLQRPHLYEQNLYSQEPYLTMRYDPKITDKINNTITAIVNIRTQNGEVFFDQLTDKYTFAWSVVTDSIFALKGLKYSLYKPSSRNSLACIVSDDIANSFETVRIEQWKEQDLVANATLKLSRLNDMRDSYGFVDNIPDFAGYMDFEFTSSFSRNYLYGNNVKIKLSSNSPFQPNVRHLNNLTYSFLNYQLTNTVEMYFADKENGVVKTYTDKSVYVTQSFSCLMKTGSETSLECRVTNTTKTDVYSPEITKVYRVSLNSTKGIICIFESQTKITVGYFPDNTLIGYKENNISVQYTDTVFYVLNYDAYIAVSDRKNNMIQMWILPGLTVELLKPYYNITAGSTGIPKSYFCPTTLDVCPDNPSVLDVLSECQDDTRVLKFIRDRNDNYYLFDINTLNHPYILPQEDLTFCTMGSELIVRTTVVQDGNLKIYGRGTDYDGALSFHTFNFQDFGIKSISKVSCQNYLRGFVVSGKDGSDGNVYATLFGNSFGQANKKYSLVTKTEFPLSDCFAVSKDELLAYYKSRSSVFTNPGFNLIAINGPYIKLKYLSDPKFDSQMNITIDRSEYQKPNIVKNFQLIIIPAKNNTMISTSKKYPAQISNFSLDKIVDFQGHVLSAQLLLKGDATSKASISPRLASFFSMLPPNLNAPLASLKYNRLYKLEQRLVSLSNDSYNSYLCFYSDYYSLESQGNKTIAGYLCQNLEIASGDTYYFIVLKCNNYNVFHIVYYLITKGTLESKQENTIASITDEVISVSVGRGGVDRFMIAKNLVTGLVFTKVKVNPDDLSVMEREVKKEKTGNQL